MAFPCVCNLSFEVFRSEISPVALNPRFANSQVRFSSTQTEANTWDACCLCC